MATNGGVRTGIRRVVGGVVPTAQSFVQTEASSGVVLLAAVALALLWANSPWSNSYFDLWHHAIAIDLGPKGVTVRVEQAGPTIMEIPLTVSLVYASGAIEDHLVKVSETTTTIDLPASGTVKSVELNRDDQALVVVDRGAVPRTRSSNEPTGTRASLRD